MSRNIYKRACYPAQTYRPMRYYYIYIECEIVVAITRTQLSDGIPIYRQEFLNLLDPLKMVNVK